LIIFADPNRRLWSSFDRQLGRRDDVMHVEGIADLDRLMAERAGEVDVLVFGPDVTVTAALEASARMQLNAPEVSVVVVAETPTPDLLHKAIRAGVKDVLPSSFTPEQLREAIDRAEDLTRKLRGRASAAETDLLNGKTHRVVSVFSSKGGSGKSFMASNLAILLAQQSGQDVALVDLDLQSGDLAIMLQLLPAWTIHDAVKDLDRLDAGALKGYLTVERSGVHLLAAPLDPSLAEKVSGAAVHRVLQLLRESFAYVVVDTPAFFSDQVLAALDESDGCVLIASLDVPSIKSLKLSLQTLEQLGLGRERIRLALNRADSKVGLRIEDVEKTLGTQIDVSIPSSRDVPLSINQGIPLAVQNRKSPVIAAISKLAAALVASGGGVQAGTQPRQGLFGRSRGGTRHGSV